MMWRKFKSWVSWSWTYLWTIWFLLVSFVIYVLRAPLKLSESLKNTSLLINTLTPKFYVALTATSSIISALILLYECWYFKKYGISFIEHLSVTHISPFFGDAEEEPRKGDSSRAPMTGVSMENSSNNLPVDCRLHPNPVNLLRGCEYQRLRWATGKEPLTPYDMSLSADEYRRTFACDCDGRPDCELMSYAWHMESAEGRCQVAHEAITKNPECAAGFILLAEEEATTLPEAEQLLREALRCTEGGMKRMQGVPQPQREQRDLSIWLYIRRRLAICARKLGRVQEAIKLLRELVKESALCNVYNVQENLIEALLTTGAYTDVQTVLLKFDDITMPKSATICYTAALLKIRAVSNRISSDGFCNRKFSSGLDLVAIDAIRRAVEFNPHVPQYLLEMRPLILPPEHIFKRGDSEAVSYAFHHLQHWKRVDGALSFLQKHWEEALRSIPAPLEKGHMFFPYPQRMAEADRQLLPSWHDVSVYPARELPFFILFTATLSFVTALVAAVTYHYPDYVGSLVSQTLHFISKPVVLVLERLEMALPPKILQQFSHL